MLRLLLDRVMLSVWVMTLVLCVDLMMGGWLRTAVCCEIVIVTLVTLAGKLVDVMGLCYMEAWVLVMLVPRVDWTLLRAAVYRMNC